MVTVDLDLIATTLEGLEETIIHRLIDRAQFALNETAYRSGASGFEGAGERSLLDMRLLYQERMDAEFGRFHVPEERPFTENLPPARRRVVLPDSPLSIDDYDRVNVTPELRRAYLELLPYLCRSGDDRQYGSAVEHDVAALQAVSRRVHYGALYVSEAKYRAAPERFAAAVRRATHGKAKTSGPGREGGQAPVSPSDHSSDSAREELLELITRPHVEERILDRVAAKVQDLQSRVNSAVRYIVHAEPVIAFFRDSIIPLTKEGQVRYLRYRAGGSNDRNTP